MKIIIEQNRRGQRSEHEVEIPTADPRERPMALDALVHAQEAGLPDLAFRYGCRNRLCGVCTIEINGRPRVACRTKLREGDRLSGLKTLPVVKDFVHRRDGVNRQLRDRLPRTTGNPDGEPEPGYHSLNRCIECYVCLDRCPMHERNFEGGSPSADEAPPPAEGYRHGNPFSLLKLQRVRHDNAATPDEREQAVRAAVDLGLDRCVDCKGCSCGVGIDLMKEVIHPLLDEAGLKN